MNRTLRYERKFPIEQYGNNGFTDEITGIPEEVFLNQELISKIRYLQMVDVELAYRVYVDLYKKSHTLATEELAKAIAYLEEEKSKTMESIQSILHTQPKEGE
jgi:hypothetical protein